MTKSISIGISDGIRILYLARHLTFSDEYKHSRESNMPNLKAAYRGAVQAQGDDIKKKVDIPALGLKNCLLQLMKV